MHREIIMTKKIHHSSADLERVRLHANLPEALSGLREDLCSVPEIDGCEINLLNEHADALVTAHLTLPQEFSGIQSTYLGFHYHLDRADANAAVFKTGISRIITEADLGVLGETTRMRFERWKIHSLAVLPLVVPLKNGKATTIGTIAVFSQSGRFSDASLMRLETLSDLYAPQIHVHWNCHQAIERGKLADVMYAEIQQFITYITQMNSLTAVDAVFSSIGSEFIGRFRFDMVNILLAEQGELSMVHTSFSKAFAHMGDRWEPFRLATKYSLSVRDGQSAMIFLSNQRFLVQDALKILHLPMSEKDKNALAILETPRTFMIVPIRLNEEVIGVMWLVSLGEPIHLPETDLTLIELLALFISTAIRNAQAHMIVEEQNRKIELLNEELKHKIVLLDQIARKDRLTGLNNFGSFEEELKRRTSESARSGESSALSVILLDVDHFKVFNDTYGHLAGNQVLQAVGARIAQAVRDMDFVARYGGEEFVVLLPQCDLKGAEMIAERIRRIIGEDFILIDENKHRITISGGCAQFLVDESADSFICRADQALYQAKHNGRNRIESARHPGELSCADTLAED